MCHHNVDYCETCFISISRLTAFRCIAGYSRGDRCIAGHYRSDGEEQQDSQNDGLHDDGSVERTADTMLYRVTATVFKALVGSAELSSLTF